MMDKNMEIRFANLRELRAEEGADGQPKITGYAAVYGAESEDLGGFVETFLPGAFSRTLEKRTQKALWNHNSDYVMGSRKAGTLEVDEDEVGLRFTIFPPDTQWARDALVTMRRGDVDQMSFSFQARVDDWKQVEGRLVRSVREAELYEISPVPFPAYPQTSAQVRSHVEEFNRLRAEEENPVDHADPKAGDTQAGDPEAEGGASYQEELARRRRDLDLMEIS